MSGLVLIIVSYYCEMKKTIFFYLTVVLINDKMIDSDSKKHGMVSLFSNKGQSINHEERFLVFLPPTRPVPLKPSWTLLQNKSYE